VKDGATETAAENASGWAAGAEAAAAAAAAAEAQQQAGPTVEELKDQLLRALAETENVRRRAQRDVGDARQYAISAFARDMLSVADNFARALAAVPEDELARNPAVASLVEGVRMTERELLNALEKHGIRTVEPRGEKFDPNLHQAMFEVERPDVPAGTVVEVVQKGSMIGERVLRPAMVVVSKGGPKAPKPEPTDTPAAAG
jgi:molecular chaperone GrpE